MKCVHS